MYNVGDVVYTTHDLRSGVKEFTPGIIIDRYKNTIDVAFHECVVSYCIAGNFKKCDKDCTNCPARFKCFTRDLDRVPHPSMVTYIKLVARYHSACSKCGKHLTTGKEIWWSPVVKGVYCMDCGVPEFGLRDLEEIPDSEQVDYSKAYRVKK